MYAMRATHDKKVRKVVLRRMNGESGDHILLAFLVLVSDYL